jgi:predicted SAM-dependent methyltransferase
VASAREIVRNRIPFSPHACEWVNYRRRRRTSRSRVDSILASGTSIKLDIGGGYRSGSNGWINVDTAFEADLYWDLREGIPFPTGSVSVIFSSHLFEHLTFSEGQDLMAEILRVLEPGGGMSIAVPNARLYLEAYVNGEELSDEFFGWEPAFNDTTAIDMVNYVAYMDGEHKYMFDQENLLHVLSAAGFSGVKARDFDPETDLAERDYESIYAIGFKP